MNVRHILTRLLILFLLINTCACKKFLETKSLQKLSTPSTLDDLQLILDNPELRNGLNTINTGTDEYFLKYADWLSRPEINKGGYVWDAKLNNATDWRVQYKTVFSANTVLANINKVNAEGAIDRRNNIEGAALFIRAHSFYALAQMYALQYDPSTAAAGLGIVLRLNEDFNEQSVRSSIKQTYEQIIHDLETAEPLLPNTTLYKSRPGKAACYAMLARVYLQMGNYAKAKENADASLHITASLIDYNSLVLTAAYPMGDLNKNMEMLYLFRTSTPLNAEEARARIDSNLYRSFDANDLRKKAFFKVNSDATATFKGNYTGSAALFNGLAVDEVYLIRAECLARQGNATAAMEDLNTLLEKRWAAGKFTRLTAQDAMQALTFVLQERKKELIYRGLRWSDLKRLNKEPAHAITIKRQLNGQFYELAANDLRYALLIPQEVLAITPLQQNPR